MDEPSESSELEIFKEFLFTLPDVLDSLTDGRFERPVLEEVACRQLYHEAIDYCFMLQNFLFNLSAVPPSPTIEVIEEGLSTVDTLRRRRRNYGMDVGNGTDSQTTDDALDAAVLSILTVSPNSGERMVIGALRSRGIRVQRSRIRGSICRVDPAGRSLRKKRAAIKRRRYNVATPNTLW
eukprot:Seg5583.1 transcript_id=Seg5583.1/GoldUCD/mRNA.D3Y31 product="hypothetical protein" protein_id=Seg5583.1/GoldUCD/D3Y31